MSLLATAQRSGQGEVPHGHRTQPHRPHEPRRIKPQDPSWLKGRGEGEMYGRTGSRYSTATRPRPILAPWRDDALWAYLMGGFKDREDGQVELACSPDVEALYYLLDTPEDVWSRMAALNLPVTLIAARESDRFRMEAPATQKFIATTPNLTVKTVPGGHFLVQEDPDRIAKLVLDYAVETGVIGPYSL